MDLSVIIVSYNVKEILRQCLLSVKKASLQNDCEIFVADNNSADGSAKMVKMDFPDVNLIQNNVNSGFSVASNQAIKLSRGDFILLLNPDTIVEPDTFSLCLKFMKEHPNAGAMGVRMVNGEGEFLPESKRSLPTPLTSFFKISGMNRLFPRSQVFNRYYMPRIGSFDTSPVEVISGAFMFINREALKSAGLPDEEFFMYGEDIDLSYRFLKAGFINYYLGSVQITHLKGKSTPADSYQDIRHFYKAMRIYSRKRNDEEFSPLYYLIIPSIRLREYLALLIRLLRIGLTGRSTKIF